MRAKGQESFSDLERENKGKMIRREVFLGEMKQAVPRVADYVQSRSR